MALIETIVIIALILKWPLVGFSALIILIMWKLIKKVKDSVEIKTPYRPYTLGDSYEPPKTIKSASVRRSYWVKHEYLFDGFVYECAWCGAKTDREYGKCPNCGCVMSGKTKYSPDYVDECEFMDLF